ncbi:MAG: hypothetical protein IJA94_00255 [Bacilli bacterium]|nr:hypothetical protein [Bacilli bacterium]
MEYTTKDFEAYYNGDDVGFNIDEAENNHEFIYNFLNYVINVKKDLSEAKNYYKNYFLEIIKGDYKTIKLFIESFKNDKGFIYTVATNYLETEQNGKNDFEISILIFESLRNYYDNEIIIKFGLRAEAYYQREIVEITKAKEQKNEPNYGYGFFLVRKDYRENPTILTYIAKKMVLDILCPNNNNEELENLFHKHYKSYEAISNPNSFLLETIRKKDSRLADYITPKIPTGFFKFLKNNIEKIKNNWQNYIKKVNMQKRFCIEEYCYQYSESHNSIFEIDDKFYDTYDIFEQIIKEKGLNIIFNIKLEPADILYNETKKGHKEDLTLKSFITIANAKGIDPAPVIKQYKLRDLQYNLNVPEDIKQFQKNLKNLIEEAFKKDIFDPNLFIFIEFNKHKNSQVVGICDADLMYGETPPKRN